MKTVITYGTFDLLHTGHVNLLKRARKLGDRLIVGVTTDSYDQSRGKLNVMESLEERMENVRKTGLADLIIKEELEGQKIHDIRKYGADVFVIGSDWSGKFDYLRDYCEVVYLERTKGVSSTDLRSARNPIVYMGIAGHGRIAGRFLRESKYVSNIEITAVFGRNEEKVRRFAESHALLEYYTESHRKNKKRIRVGMICMIVIPLIFLMLMFTMNSSKIVYLVFWIISLFALCTYLIAVEYMDYNLQERMKELGVTSHKKKEAIIGPKVIGQDIENLKERIGL